MTKRILPALSLVCLVLLVHAQDTSNSTSDGLSNTVSRLGSGVFYDGYNYSTVLFGNHQEWMAENLRSDNYNNGDPIINVVDSSKWSTLTSGAWVHYDNDSKYESICGKLYNWYAASDPRNLCPTGWHVPTDKDWTRLTEFLEGYLVAGYRIKSSDDKHWPKYNQDTLEVSLFEAVPSGNRDSEGVFRSVQTFGGWWSSTESGTENAWGRCIYDDNSTVTRGDGEKKGGFSVRCIKD